MKKDAETAKESQSVFLQMFMYFKISIYGKYWYDAN